MPYRHPAARIHEIVQAPKDLAAGQSVEQKKHGSHGLGCEGAGGRFGLVPRSKPSRKIGVQRPLGFE